MKIVKIIYRVLNKIERMLSDKYSLVVLRYIDGNVFNKTNHIVNKHNIDIRHTLWGKHSGIGDYAEIVDAKIGNFSLISSNCKIGVRDHIYQNFTISDIFYKGKEYVMPSGINQLDGYWVEIGNDVWIGGVLPYYEG